jgi:hypothetical protein
VLPQASFKQRMSIDQQIKVSVLLIATRKYKQFVPAIVKQLDRFFLPGKEIAITIFSDELIQPPTSMRVQMVWTKIASLGWPYATLRRYEIFSQFSEYLKKYSHLFYIDVDMAIESEVGDAILGDSLTVTRHPGFYALGGWGSPNVNSKSKAYIPAEEWTKGLKYFAGGFQGGETISFLKMCKELAENISDDESRNIIAEHNDESHLNQYLWSHPEISRIELTPQYCMVQSEVLRKNWKIDHLPVSIVALDKDHKAMRS